jgi:hypothetical protein
LVFRPQLRLVFRLQQRGRSLIANSIETKASDDAGDCLWSDSRHSLF